MIFVDSCAWFALFVESSEDHDQAIEWRDVNTSRLLTTDYVVDETLTLLTARGHKYRALGFGAQFFGPSRDLAALYRVDEYDLSEAWDVFRKFTDKQWSFTDCTSYVVMRRLGIDTAFTFDEHFRQFGFVTVVP